jgi:hypothetical protein
MALTKRNLNICKIRKQLANVKVLNMEQKDKKFQITQSHHKIGKLAVHYNMLPSINVSGSCSLPHLILGLLQQIEKY